MTKVKIIRLIEPKVKEVKINDKEKEASLEEMTNDESPETKAWLSTDTERPTTLIRVDRERQVAAPREQPQTPVANERQRQRFPIQDDEKKNEAQRDVAEVRTKRKMPWDI